MAPAPAPAPVARSAGRRATPRRNLQAVFQEEHSAASLTALVAGLNVAPSSGGRALAPRTPTTAVPAAAVAALRTPVAAAARAVDDATPTRHKTPRGGRHGTTVVKDGAFFHAGMLRERAALQALCDEWRECADAEAAVCIGQATLLIAQRFAQYADLCASFDGARVGAGDLEGFWEVILYQVAEVKARFARLGQVGAVLGHGWRDECSFLPRSPLLLAGPHLAVLAHSVFLLFGLDRHCRARRAPTTAWRRARRRPSWPRPRPPPPPPARRARMSQTASSPFFFTVWRGETAA